MTAAIEKYFAPTTIEEACSLFLDYKEEAKIIAGGTDLLLWIKAESYYWGI